MERKVWSFIAAIQYGFEPRSYIYDPKQIPLGEFDAVLDFKIWSKRVMAINGYFTKVTTGEKFTLTIYCDNQFGKYMIKASPIDFSDCATGQAYRILITMNSKYKPVLSKVDYIS